MKNLNIFPKFENFRQFSSRSFFTENFGVFRHFLHFGYVIIFHQNDEFLEPRFNFRLLGSQILMLTIRWIFAQKFWAGNYQKFFLKKYP